MTLEFPQGIPAGCAEWLDVNVGSVSNLNHVSIPDSQDEIDYDKCDWLFEQKMLPSPEGLEGASGGWVPTITVNDPKLATLFVLMWGA